MGYVAGQPMLWPAPPDWSQGVTETLTWLTDVMQSSGTAMQQTRALLAAPRRTYTIQTLDGGDARRIIDAIAFNLGTHGFLFPIYPDVQWLSGPLTAAINVIPCATAGYDFVVGGKVALWLDEQHWELATVAAIGPNTLTLTALTANAWPVGTRLYPLRAARLQDMPEATQSGAAVSSLKVNVLIDEPCDWPAAWPSAAAYRGVPVLEWRGDESDNPTVQYARQGSTVDVDTATIYYFDLPNLPFRLQVQNFILYGRDQHTAFRSLLYALAGRAGQMWVPSWLDDLRLTAAIAGNAVQLQVAPCYYSLFGAQQTNRRDIRIELYDGTVFYRRITGSAQLVNGEMLQIDTALGQGVTPDQVRQINWLSMCQLAGDSVTNTHVTDADGVATCSLQWQAVQNNV
ncbi:hypothetical protein [Dyella sp.]|uniref:hypothetical protein n=1 Tax=Dyella sp. TaxID=1869338 RepID=UPI0028402B8B|nr:hypothetical protein [Dyella sp.]MDR3444696.1 hypothetical protein [Dyella sp.]